MADAANPDHYSLFNGEKQTLDLQRDLMSEAEFSGYLEGCAIKYLTRWKRKGGIADLHKCIRYLELLADFRFKTNADPADEHGRPLTPEQTDDALAESFLDIIQTKAPESDR